MLSENEGAGQGAPKKTSLYPSEYNADGRPDQYAIVRHWITERESIHRKRAAGLPQPWTDDAVLASHRFCNVRRSDDRVSLWVRENVGRKYAGHPHQWIMFAIARLLNRIDVLDELIAKGAWPTTADFDPRSMLAVLEDRAKRGLANRSNAYRAAIVRGESRDTAAVLIVRDLWLRRAEFSELLAGNPTMQQVHAALKRTDGLGDFISYQIVVDASYCALLGNASDVNSWAACGPGTIRGLNRLHGRPVKAPLDQRKALRELVPLYHAIRKDVPEVPIALSDVCNIACEFDKFCRYSRGETEEGEVSESGGKKGSFKPSEEPLPVANDEYAVASASSDNAPSPSAEKPPPPDPIPHIDDPVVDSPSSEPEHDPNFDDARPGDDSPHPGDGRPHLLFRDYETKSAADLKSVGARKYAQHPSTDVWCCAYAIDDGPLQIWKSGDPVPPEFVEAAKNSNWQVVAFNDAFERAIETHILGPRYGWPTIPIERHRCLQASALALALPASLAGVAGALGLAEEKDEAGKRLMREMARPRRPSLDEDPTRLYWHDAPEQLARLYAYCKQDVATARALHARIGLLPDAEQAVWLLDQRINDRGIRIDRALAEGGAKIAAAASAIIDAEIDELTEGEVGSARQVTKLLSWLAAQGVALDRARVDDVDEILKRADLCPAVRRVLELRRDGAHIAGAKFSAMLAQAGDGDRVCGSFKYHGAATGRWTAHGVQPQNLKKPNGLDLAPAIELVAGGDYERIKQHYDNPLAVVGSVARAAIVAAPGHRLIAADFSGIESRVLAWLAGESSKLKLWADFDAGGDDPYAVLGLRMGFPKDVARETGKVADLAFGYMGGAGAYRKFGDANTPEGDIKRLQKAWRDAHPRTVTFWYALDRAAKRAVAKPGIVAKVNDRVAFCADGTFLRMRLPSGRKIAYPFARNEAGTDKFDRPATVVHFKDNAGGKWVDARGGQGAWPGLWAENAVQAVARDLLAAAMLRLGSSIVLHVHDEIVAEVLDGFGSEEEFVRIITGLPEWAGGLPIGAKVRSGPRFVEVEASSAKVEDPPPNEDDGEPNSPPWADDTIADASNEPAAEPAPAAKIKAPRPSADWDYARGERDSGQRIATYEYPNEAGENYHRKFRTSTHQFPQQHWDGRRWVGGGPPSKIYYPYGLHQLLAAPLDVPVWVAEGEKDRDTLAAQGLIAVCNPNGAGKFSRDFTREQLDRWFKGRATVYAPEDNDAKGRQHVDDIGRALSDLGCEVRIIPFRDMPEKSDVSDWLAIGHTKTDLLVRPWVRWAPPRLQSVCAANVVMRIMTWLWPNRFAIGELGILAGLPDEGKGQVFAFMTATVTRGGAWPCDEGTAPKGNVIILTAEDDLATTARAARLAPGTRRSSSCRTSWQRARGRRRS